MGILSNLAYDDAIKQETDSVGGAFTLFPSAIYDAVVKMAYLQKSSTGSLGLYTSYTINEQEYKETFWITNKEGQNYYIDKNSGDKKYLGGFIHADALCGLAAKKPLSEMDTEVKLVKIYSKDAGGEVPTKVEVLVDLIGKPVKLGIISQKVFKQEKSDGKYVDTDETKEENNIDKVFRSSDSKTTAELRAKSETADFAGIWEAKWAGKVKDRTKGKTPKGAAGKAGLPGSAPTTTKPTSSLFDD